MTIAYVLDATGRQPTAAILFESMAGRPPPVRTDFRSARCPKCGKVHTAGFPELSELPELLLDGCRLDFVRTPDDFYLVSAALAELLRDACGTAAVLAPVAGGRYFALRCRDRVAPEPDARVYNPVEPADPADVFHVRGRRCHRCGRPREVTWAPAAYPFPAEFALIAFEIDGPYHIGTSVCCSPTVGARLAAARPAGLRLLPVTRRAGP